MKLAYGVSLFLCFWSDWKPHRILNIYTQDMRLRGSGHRERQWLCSQEYLENRDFLVFWEIASMLALPYSFAISLIHILNLFFEPGVSHMTFHAVFSFPILCRSCVFFQIKYNYSPHELSSFFIIREIFLLVHKTHLFVFTKIPPQCLPL